MPSPRKVDRYLVVDSGVSAEERDAMIEASGARAVHFLGDLVVVRVDADDPSFPGRVPQGLRLAESLTDAKSLLRGREVALARVQALELSERKRAAGRASPDEGKPWDELLDDGEARQ